MNTPPDKLYTPVCNLGEKTETEGMSVCEKETHREVDSENPVILFLMIHYTLNV